MTTLIVNDGNPIEITTQGDESVFDVLLATQDQWNQNQLIQSVMVNGTQVVPLDETIMMAIEAHDAEIRISVAAPKARSLKDTAEETLVYLDRLAKGFATVAEGIRHSNSESFGQMRDGLSGLSTVLELAEVLAIHKEASVENRDEFHAFLAALQEKSTELAEAQEGGDPTLIADILEYEFIDSVQELKEYIERMIDNLF